MSDDNCGHRCGNGRPWPRHCLLGNVEFLHRRTGSDSPVCWSRTVFFGFNLAFAFRVARRSCLKLRANRKRDGRTAPSHDEATEARWQSNNALDPKPWGADEVGMKYWILGSGVWYDLIMRWHLLNVIPG